MSVALPILQTTPQRPHFAQGPRSLASVRLLRLSVTDQCNLRCHYCMPEQGVPFAAPAETLQPADFEAVARAARRIGVTHFKVTGGEPTLRRDVIEIVHRLASTGPDDLSMTTNALRLEQLAQPLREAGLDRLTVSCDSLDAARFAHITGASRSLASSAFDRLWRGIDAATDAGFQRLKLNVVVIGGFNDDEVAEFARLTFDRPWTVRFIEYMPLGESRLTDAPGRYIVDNEAIRARIEAELGPLTPVDPSSEAGVGPASVYRLPGSPAGRLGFISAMSQPFCETCNRLRLTAKGQLQACLFEGGAVDVVPLLRRGADEAALIDAMRRCVTLKPEVHGDRGKVQMSQLGG